MAKQPQQQAEQPTEASRIAALEEWSQSTAAFMESVNTRVSECENAIRDLGSRVEALEAAAKDNAHVSRATAEGGVIDGDVFERVKRLERHAGIEA